MKFFFLSTVCCLSLSLVLSVPLLSTVLTNRDSLYIVTFHQSLVVVFSVFYRFYLLVFFILTLTII